SGGRKAMFCSLICGHDADGRRGGQTRDDRNGRRGRSCVTQQVGSRSGFVGVFMAAAVGSMLLGATPAWGAGAGTWSVQKTFAASISPLYSISCPTTSDCWAVG